ncbi:MAG: hypothetical protein CYPHOPRED_001184 [Cyphobasidiales sp. Tagirdzhanova-0007]|nr:MAG: hypothetical protein CYPHOPRED_001184 [Cyphobasidiales sp. Tagirdzhanova-0007]
MSAGEVLSGVLGWTSTIAWSASLYPQAMLNFQRHSVRGLSIDFIYLNVHGFLAYSMYNTGLFVSTSVRQDYRQRNGGHDPSVRGNDVAFAVHAFVISLLTLGQTFFYDRDAKQAISSFSALFIAMTTILAMAGIFSAGFGLLAWLDLLYCLSYLKLAISFIKYIPQAWLNFKRKSTVGWSIHNILLDFTGGVCSIAQVVVDERLQDDWGAIRGNPAKL